MSGLLSDLVGPVLGLAILAACQSNPTTEPEPPTLFREHKFLTSAAQSKSMGEDCTTGGASDCKKDAPICWHYAAETPEAGYVCTRACSEEEDCPRDWGCVSISSGEGNSFCAPPLTWLPSAAAPRAKATSKESAQ